MNVEDIVAALRGYGSDVAPALKAGASGVVQGVAGWPADTAVNAVNLARALYGYGGKQMGLLSTEQMPETIDPANVPLTSAYIHNKMGVGDSGPEQAAEFVGSMLAPGPKGVRKPPVKQELITYHGSPHLFPPTADNPLGAFDSSKMGSGQGAQVYGAGHYLAEAQDAGKQYRRNLGGVEVRVGDVPLEELIKKGGDTADAARRLRNDFGSSSIAQHPDQVTDPQFWKATEDYYRKFRSDRTTGKVAALLDEYGPVSARLRGHLYTVDLPDEHIAKMLDFDKPLKQQPKIVQEFFSDKNPAMQKTMQEYGLTSGDLQDASGKFLYEILGSDRQASAALRAAGIPGNRYLDAGSRAAGKGTSHFVVYDDNIPKIIGRE